MKTEIVKYINENGSEGLAKELAQAVKELSKQHEIPANQIWESIKECFEIHV